MSIDFDFTFNIWENALSIIGILVGIFVSIYLYRLEKRISKKEKYDHEVKVTKQLLELGFGKSVILSDSKKYPNYEKDPTNKSFSEKGAEIYGHLPGYGCEFIIKMESKSDFLVGLVPFEWIDYIREKGDGANTKPIIVCKFKGVRYYKNHKSPFKKTYIRKN